MKALIVEDSRLAREELSSLLKSFPEISIVGEASNVKDALVILNNKNIDLLFLDINLPGKNGFELLEMLDSVPLVIFTTAYDQYAIKSFDYNALDYLLKPIKLSELERAILKAKRIFDKESIPIEKRLSRVFIKDGQKCWLININEIIMFESEGNYTKVFFEDNKPLIYKSLNMIEERIDPAQFFRANRSQIINLNAIKSIKSSMGTSLKIILNNNMDISVSRRNVQKLKTLLSF
ncbi:two-component system response regulator [bacterium BRH_c32]|nr:MAG: two-component system response regulator [bacterium BRH_c32]